MSRKKKAVIVDTIIHILVDKSYSMNSCKGATIEGYNGYVHNLQEDKDCGETLVSLSLFDTHSYDTVYSASKPDDVPDLNSDVYKPRGGTPLWDAVGETIKDTEKDLQKVKGKPNVLIVIITDGEENSSKSYKSQEIKEMVVAKEEEGWSFIYLGANQDAWAIGATMGISRGNSMTYDTANMKDTIELASAGTSMYRSKAFVARSAGLTDYKEEAFFEDAIEKLKKDRKEDSTKA